MAQFFFRALPVVTARDATMDFEQLTFALNNGEVEVNGKGELALKPTGAWTNVEALSAKLEGSTLQVRTEGSKTVARLKGSAKAKEAIPASTALFTLPAGFRPVETNRYVGVDTTAGSEVFMGLLISTAGVVESAHELPISHFLSVAGITLPLT